MVEALYQDPRTVVYEHPVFSKVKQHRSSFLSKSLVRKYLREIHGIKGFKLVEGLVKDNKPEEKERTFKKFYILLRLLLFAQKVLAGSPSYFQVWLDDTSEERKFLLDVRLGKYSYEFLMEEAKRRDQLIKEQLETSTLKEDAEELAIFLNNWLFDVRLKNFSSLPSSLSFNRYSAYYFR